MLSFVGGLDVLSDGFLMVKEVSQCCKFYIFIVNIGLKNLVLNINLLVGMERLFDLGNGGEEIVIFFSLENNYVFGNLEYDLKCNKYSKE